MDHAPRFLQLVESVRPHITELTIDALLAERAQGRRLLLLDVREDSEWAAGHIPSAQHLGKGVIERDIERQIPDPAAEIVLYCGGGYRSALAACALQDMGYTRVRSLAGGYRGWQEAGRPIEELPADEPPGPNQGGRS